MEPRPIDELLADVAGRGFRVALENGTPTLKRQAVKASVPAWLMQELRDRRGEVVEQLSKETVCQLCHSTWYCSEAEILEACAGPHFCDRGGSWKHKVQRCPYKRDE